MRSNWINCWEIGPALDCSTFSLGWSTWVNEPPFRKTPKKLLEVQSLYTFGAKVLTSKLKLCFIWIVNLYFNDVSRNWTHIRVFLLLQSRTHWKHWLIVDVVIEWIGLFIKDLATQNWWNINETLMIQTLYINALISSISMFHWIFNYDSLMKHRWNIYETLIVLIETVKSIID